MAKDKEVKDILKTTENNARDATKALKANTKSISDWHDQMEEAGKVEGPNEDYAKNFAGYIKAATQEQEKWTVAIKSSVAELAEQARQIGSWRSQLKDATGALGAFANQMKQSISLTGIHTQALKEFRQGSEAYSASLNLSTASMGKASGEAQKYMDAIHDAYVDARNVAGDYGMEVEKVREVSTNLQKTFGSQLGAMDNQSKALVRLQKETVIFSRLTGIDTGEAIQRMDERLSASGKTLDGVRVEMLEVSKVIDDYKIKLRALGKEAQLTGSLTAKDFLGVMKEVRSQFRQGIFDAGAFSKSLTFIGIEGKKAGFTREEMKSTVSGLGKVISSMSDMSSYWGVNAAQMLQNMGKEIEASGNEALMKRLKFARESDVAPVQQLKLIMGAMKGTALGQGLIYKSLRTTLDKSQLQEVTEKASGGDAWQAQMMTRMIASGEAEKMALDTAKMSEEERKKAAAEFASPMENLAKAAATATDARHLAAKKLYEYQQKILGWMEKYPYMMAAIMAGAQLVGGGGGLGLLAKGAGGIGSLLTGGSGLAATIAAGIVAVPAAAVAGWVAGGVLDKAVGGVISENASEGTRNMMGSDKTISNWLASNDTGRAILEASPIGRFLKATTSFNKTGWKMLQDNTFRIGWVELAKRTKLLTGLTSEIDILEKKKKLAGSLTIVEQRLLDEKKKAAAALLANRAVRQQYDAEKNVGKTFGKAQVSDIIGMSGRLDTSDVKTKGEFQELLSSMVNQSGRLWMQEGAGGAFKKALSTESITGEKFLPGLRKKAAELKIPLSEVVTMFEQASKQKAQEMLLKGATLGRKDLETPITAPEAATKALGEAGKSNMTTTITGTDGVREKTVKMLPNGGYEEQHVITVNANVKTVVNGTEAGKLALINQKNLQLARGNAKKP